MTSPLSFAEIRRLLPHAPPWVLLDQVIELNEAGGWISAIKQISGSDPLLAAHLVERGNYYPGVLLIEMVGQAATILEILTSDNKGTADNRATHVLSRCRASFKSPLSAGQSAVVRVSRKEIVMSSTRYEGEVWCGDILVASVEIYGTRVHSA